MFDFSLSVSLTLSNLSAVFNISTNWVWVCLCYTRGRLSDTWVCVCACVRAVQCMCCPRSRNGVGPASSRESYQRGGVQRLLHGDGCRLLLRLRRQEQDIPVQVLWILNRSAMSRMFPLQSNMRRQLTESIPDRCDSLWSLVQRCWARCELIHPVIASSDSSEAKRFCHEHECPANWNNANEMNCCVYHANIHSCPLGLMVSNRGVAQLWRHLTKWVWANPMWQQFNQEN